MHQQEHRKARPSFLPLQSRVPHLQRIFSLRQSAHILIQYENSANITWSGTLCTGDRPDPGVVFPLLSRYLPVLKERWITQALKKHTFLRLHNYNYFWWLSLYVFVVVLYWKKYISKDFAVYSVILNTGFYVPITSLLKVWPHSTGRSPLAPAPWSS